MLVRLSAHTHRSVALINKGDCHGVNPNLQFKTEQSSTRETDVKNKRKILPIEDERADAVYRASQRGAEQALLESEQRYRELVAMLREAVLLHSEGRIVFASEAAAWLFGADASKQVLGKSFLDFVHPRNRDAVAKRLGKPATGRSAPFARHRLVRLDGTAFNAEVAASACGYQGEPAVQLLVREDGAKRRRLESQLAYLAQYDQLTELPNRSQFRDRLGGAIARASRNKQPMGILFLGLDRFQMVNATMGQEAGDLVLKQAARRLMHSVRKSDSVARLGGDEFAVILEGVAEREGAAVVALRAQEALSLAFQINGKETQVTASIGIAVFPLDGNDIDALLRNAEVAMHHAKKQGRNNYQHYTPESGVYALHDELCRAETRRMFMLLTPREREVLDMLVAGKSNKMIAYLLGASPRTIEHHRAKIMSKMRAGSLAELVRLASTCAASRPYPALGISTDFQKPANRL